MNRNDELKNCITKKFQALIVKALAQRLVTHAGVRERFRQQKRIAELVTNAFFERCHIRVILSEHREYYTSLTRDKAGDNRQANPRLLVDEPSLRYRL